MAWTDLPEQKATPVQLVPLVHKARLVLTVQWGFKVCLGQTGQWAYKGRQALTARMVLLALKATKAFLAQKETRAKSAQWDHKARRALMALLGKKVIWENPGHRDYLGQTDCPAHLANRVRLDLMAWQGQRATQALTGRLVLKVRRAWTVNPEKQDLKAQQERMARKAFQAKSARQERMESPDRKATKGRRASKERPAPLARTVTTLFPSSQKRLRLIPSRERDGWIQLPYAPTTFTTGFGWNLRPPQPGRRDQQARMGSRAFRAKLVRSVPMEPKAHREQSAPRERRHGAG